MPLIKVCHTQTKLCFLFLYIYQKITKVFVYKFISMFLFAGCETRTIKRFVKNSYLTANRMPKSNYHYTRSSIINSLCQNTDCSCIINYIATKWCILSAFKIRFILMYYLFIQNLLSHSVPWSEMLVLSGQSCRNLSILTVEASEVQMILQALDPVSKKNDIKQRMKMIFSFKDSNIRNVSTTINSSPAT